MKRLYFLLVCTALLSAFTLLSDIDNVVNAMKSGDAAQVATFFDDKVEITITEKTNSYTKAQAQTVLQNFFSSNPVKGFDIIHKGGNDGSEFCIGTLQTAKGAFRTTIFMKQKVGGEVLQEIKFE
jgi:hypothetical protein